MGFKQSISRLLKLLFREDVPSIIGSERLIVFIRWIIIFVLIGLLTITTDVNKHAIKLVFYFSSLYNLLLMIFLYSRFSLYFPRIVQYTVVFIDEAILITAFALVHDTNNIVYTFLFFAIFGVSLRMKSKDSYVVSVINTVVLPITLYSLSPSFFVMIKAGMIAIASMINLFSTRVLEVNAKRLEQETRNTNIMLSMSNVINSIMEIEPLLEIVIYELVTRLSVIAGVIALFDAEKDDFVYIASSGNLDIIGGYVSKSMLDDYLMNTVITEKKYVIISDHSNKIDLVDSWFETIKTSSFLLFPFVCNDRYTGVIGLFGQKDNKQFSQYYLTILKGVSSQIVTGINRAFLYEDLIHNKKVLTKLLTKLETAHEDERKKIVGELHDITSEIIYKLNNAIEEIIKGVKNSGFVNKDDILKLRSLIQGTQRQLRKFLSTLRSTVLEDFGLVHAMKDLLGNFRQKYNIDVEFINEKDEYPLIPLQKEILYKIANEALLNVAKHASASNVVIKLYEEGSNIVMSISDNGKGFNTSEKFENKYGLLYMKERVNSFKGKINIISAKGKGTTITVSLPLHDFALRDKIN